MVDEDFGLYDGTGPSTKTLVWQKSPGAGQTFMQSVANTLFFGNGVVQKKWVNSSRVDAKHCLFRLHEDVLH